MFENPLFELSCWDMLQDNSKKTKNLKKKTKMNACLLSSIYKDSPMKLLNAYRESIYA